MRTFTITIFCFLLLTSTSVFAQKNGLNVTTETKIMGKNYMDNSDIKGVEYVFPNRIDACFFNSENGFLTVLFAGIGNLFYSKAGGDIIQYDLMNEKILWTATTYFASNFKQDFQTVHLQIAKDGIIRYHGEKCYFLDAFSGNKIWEVKNIIFLVDYDNNIGIGYKSDFWSQYSDDFEGINLKDGSKIWERKLVGGAQWYENFYINDSTLIVVSESGLHSLNVLSGNGWNFRTVTNSKETNNLISNTLVDSTSIYFASRVQIVKMDKLLGNIVWNNKLTIEWTSKSSIFMNDSVIYMINRGFATTPVGYKFFGKAYIAAYDKQTGKQKYLSLIKSKNGYILNFRIIDNDIYLLFKNKIVKYDLERGSQIFEKEFPKKIYGSLKYFVGSRVFVSNQEDIFKSIVQNEPTKLHIYTTLGKIFSLNYQLNLTNTVEQENIGIYFLSYKDYKFITSKGKTYIINDEGQIIAELDLSSNAFIVGDYLYDKKDRSFYAVDLKNIIH